MLKKKKSIPAYKCNYVTRILENLQPTLYSAAQYQNFQHTEIIYNSCTTNLDCIRRMILDVILNGIEQF